MSENTCILIGLITLAIYLLQFKSWKEGERLIYGIVVAVILLFAIQCGGNARNRTNNKKRTVAYKEFLKGKFYCPKAYDDWWRAGASPNLIGSEGWITDDCRNSELKGEKIQVLDSKINHKSWGNYIGTLEVEVLATQSIIIIDFKCFKPDYTLGEWLDTKKRSDFN